MNQTLPLPSNITIGDEPLKPWINLHKIDFNHESTITILLTNITGWWWLEPWNLDWLSRNSWECHHPNWLSVHHFSEGELAQNHQPDKPWDSPIFSKVIFQTRSHGVSAEVGGIPFIGLNIVPYFFQCVRWVNRNSWWFLVIKCLVWCSTRDLMVFNDSMKVVVWRFLVMSNMFNDSMNQMKSTKMVQAAGRLVIQPSNIAISSSKNITNWYELRFAHWTSKNMI